MNKLYFTRYLPFEKNGDENCIWQWYNNVKNTGWENISHSDMDAIIAHGLQPAPQFRKLKLFLCSTDVQIGNELYYPNGMGPEIMDDTEKHKAWIEQHGLFKIIGEISREATWVKEGDEFDKEELALNGIWQNWCSKTPLSGKNIVFIKGPCGHFH